MSGTIGLRIQDARAARRSLLVQYTAAWCGSCKAADGVVRSFCAAQGRMAPEVMDIDVDRCVYDVGVSEVPTYHLYRQQASGHLTHIGVNGLQKWLQTHGD